MPIEFLKIHGSYFHLTIIIGIMATFVALFQICFVFSWSLLHNWKAKLPFKMPYFYKEEIGFIFER